MHVFFDDSLLGILPISWKNIKNLQALIQDLFSITFSIHNQIQIISLFSTCFDEKASVPEKKRYILQRVMCLIEEMRIWNQSMIFHYRSIDKVRQLNENFKKLYTVLSNLFFVPDNPPSKLLRRLFPWINNIQGFFLKKLVPYFFDTLTYQWIMCTSQYHCLNIRRELWEILSEVSFKFFSRCDSLLYDWNKPRSWNLFYSDRTIKYMNSFSIHTGTNCRLCCENSDFSISSFDHCLRTRNRHSENMSRRIDVPL